MSIEVFDNYFKEGRKIVTVKDVEPEQFIKAFSQHLKRQGRFELPKWADVVKTSKAKELPPSDPDWLYVRTASMVRKIYIRKGMGVGAFKKVYGGQKRRGTCTNVYTKASGKIARYILQQLEEMGLVEQDDQGGRMITKEGQRELDTVAVQAAAEEVLLNGSAERTVRMQWLRFIMSIEVFDNYFKDHEGRKIVTVKDVEPEQFIKAFSQHLKRQGRFELPKWADVVKTSKAKELPPSDPDWLYVRTASMVRKIYIRKGMGVGAFKKVYGGQKRRGTCTNVYTKASGKIARYILQQLEEMGLVEQDDQGGRMITKEGQRELDTVAVQAAAEEEEED
ncbi:RPS19B [Symbiodinium pilosum]|uniref:RPS19B protein n=1 Tax=Symbiodinium pilosum TaxID=2952 RepID=A0A812JHW2_SYMPI|nr:RPS19B [Symbiodinium pilosum]